MSLIMNRLQESLGSFVQEALTLKGLSLGVILVFVGMNVKGLPLMWHVRFDPKTDLFSTFAELETNKG